ncbi:hypothetical protein [Xanthomonas perforans]|uniref:hypothetical protein n=1 Tax=Xanthomonas perforans TaxID=442694 RepID=UPI002358560F|nr:hypothetical protein [Xanthomonas perforans]MDC9654384.1 hypothetical protein [Xanthomonas perforans]
MTRHSSVLPRIRRVVTEAGTGGVDYYVRFAYSLGARQQHGLLLAQNLPEQMTEQTLQDLHDWLEAIVRTELGADDVLTEIQSIEAATDGGPRRQFPLVFPPK